VSAVEAEVLPPEPTEQPKKSKPKALARREETAIAAQSSDGQMLQTLMTEAIRSGNKELMREVMEIRRELKAEAAKEAFNTALSAFQAECPVIEKKKVVREKQERGGGVRYRYAPLDYIQRVAGPYLTKHGFSYELQADAVGSDKEGYYMEATCTMRHAAGHEHTPKPFRIPITFSDFMNKQQSFGSASTFSKRYAFCGAFGIATGDEDDDGQAAGYTPNQARELKNARQPVSQPRQTPTAQKAEADKKGSGNGKEKPQIEPAGEGEAIDANTVRGLNAAMEHAKLTNEDFVKRFPALNGVEQVKKTDSRVVMAWIADPASN